MHEITLHGRPWEEVKCGSRALSLLIRLTQFLESNGAVIVAALNGSSQTHAKSMSHAPPMYQRLFVALFVLRLEIPLSAIYLGVVLHEHRHGLPMLGTEAIDIETESIDEEGEKYQLP